MNHHPNHHPHTDDHDIVDPSNHHHHNATTQRKMTSETMMTGSIIDESCSISSSHTNTIVTSSPSSSNRQRCYSHASQLSTTNEGNHHDDEQQQPYRHHHSNNNDHTTPITPYYHHTNWWSQFILLRFHRLQPKHRATTITDSTISNTNTTISSTNKHHHQHPQRQNKQFQNYNHNNDDHSSKDEEEDRDGHPLPSSSPLYMTTPRKMNMMIRQRLCINQIIGGIIPKPTMAFMALMKRNIIYRKRNWLSSLFELLLPSLFLILLVFVKRSYDNSVILGVKIPGGDFLRPGDSFIPQPIHTYQPMTFTDTITVLQAKKVCKWVQDNSTTANTEDDDSHFEITGIDNRSKNWQIPYMKCNSQLCTEIGQDATNFCEVSIFAISSTNVEGSIRALSFYQYLVQRYPSIFDSTTNQSSFIKLFQYQEDMIDDDRYPTEYGKAIDRYVRSSQYGTSIDKPKISMAIVFDGNDPDAYLYAIRQNSTNYNIAENQDQVKAASKTTPKTQFLLDTNAASDFETCVAISLSNQITELDLGVLGTSCTGQYMYNGVLAAQRLVHDYILYDTGAQDDGYFVSEAGVQFVQFPQASYNPTGFFENNITTPVLLALGLLFTVASMIGYIVQEKELRQKELMKMMSVTECDIEISWFLTYIIFNIVAGTLCTIVSCFLFPYSSLYLLWIFWMFTFLSLTFYCTTLAACSSKATRGVLVGLLCFFSGLFPAIIFPIASSSSALVGIIMIHPIATFTYGISILGGLDDISMGLTSDTVNHVHEDLQYSFQAILVAYTYSSIIWFVLTWYLNRIVKPEYGQAMYPYYFPFTKSYWGSLVGHHPDHDETISTTSMLSGQSQEGTIPTNHHNMNDDNIPNEPVSESIYRQHRNHECIHIQNLHKSFNSKNAVNGLNLSMYNGQITALLGHNGAGKTTTINMLTGAVAPTSGYATVAGKDIRTQMPEIRRDVGICMQHDCLFPRLTVREHVEFFSRLKGIYNDLSREEADQHVDQAIIDVALWEKRHTYSSKLSGGMKRKLSVAIAFCGGSKVVVLDEPTSGMDPFSRRFTWNVIRHYRQNRIIILTTHFMDEADILGDRIAIMSEGKLCCVGSSLFLKKVYGVGYQLTIEKNQLIGHPPHGGIGKTITCQLGGNAIYIDQSDEGSIEVSEDGLSRPEVVNAGDRTSRTLYACTRELKHIVMDSVPEARLLSDVGSELSYQLPLGSSPQFTALFEKLDHQIEKGSMSCYGVSITTLDEVFLMVTRGDRPEKAAFASSRQSSTDLLANRGSNECDESSIVNFDDNVPFKRHLRTLLKKRAAIFRRDKKAWLFTTILPCIFVFMGFVLFNFVSVNQTWTPLTLRLEDLNTEIMEPSVQNPIAVNSPDSPFMCQIPTCSHKRPFVQEELTDEVYFFCGLQAKLGISYEGYTPTNSTCYISDSVDVINSLTNGGASADETIVSNISSASESLLLTEKQHAASRFGAVWFTHEPDSIMDDGTSYSETVINQCELVSAQSNYSRPEDCKYFGGYGYIIQYNFSAIHAAPLYQALADEALVRHATGNKNLTIQSTIAVLPNTLREDAFGKAEDAFVAWFLVVLSFPFISGAFATFVVSERYSKAKHMQSVAGVEPTSYWLSTYIWDVVNYQIPFLIILMLMFAFDVDVLTTKNRDILSGVITILSLFGPASAGFTYCASFAFQSASLCNITVIISGFLIGMGGPLTCYVLYLRSIDPRGPQPELADVANVLAWFLRWNPSFCLGKGLFNAIYIETFTLVHQNDDISAWDPEILLIEVYCLAIQSVVYIILAINIDKWSTNPYALSLWQNCKNLCWVWRLTKPIHILPTQVVDDDVLAEQDLVLSGKVCTDSILIKKLTKVYGNGKVAVNNLSLGVAPGECFGLLGINGAGKTTTMGLLTAEFPPTSGDAILGGYSITHEPQKIRRRIGYCPQFCAHFENMTGREHVEMYAAIKGVPEHIVKDAVSKKLQQVGLSDYDSDRLSTHYSGGMKRRLSLACATIGQPQIVFLDECSTGVDPLARREIWQLVSDMVVGHGDSPTYQPAVILTTHSMEECEALCPRIGIMANGQLRCLGSAQHLKSKFGKGYQLEVKVKHVSRKDIDFQECLIKLIEQFNTNNSNTATTTASSISPSEIPSNPIPDPSTSSMVVIDDEMIPTIITSQPIVYNVDECKQALECLTGNDRLSKMIDANDPIGFSIWKEASTSSPCIASNHNDTNTRISGVDVYTLATFATCEQRMVQLESYIDRAFPKNVLRERQDTKARYEVECDGMKISSIFASIEQHKDTLWLADYCVSQTSLEQVFNMHAAEAERSKVDQVDG